MTKLALTATAAAFALAGAAHAQVSPYVNAGVGYLDGETANLTGAFGRAGADIGQYFGLEAEGALGIDGDTVGATEVELDHLVAGFARARAPLSPRLEAFARGGYFFSEGDATTAGTTVALEEDDFAAGAGLQWNFTERNGLRADYTNYGISDDGHAMSLAYVLGF